MKTSMYVKSSKGLPYRHSGTRFKSDRKFLKSLEVKHELPDEYAQTLRTTIILIACAFITVLLF